MRIPFTATLLVGLTLMTSSAGAVTVTSGELSEAGRWIAAKFQGKPEAKPAQGYLSVYVKSGEVQKNMSAMRVYAFGAGSRPLRIVDKEYPRGLYFPSEGQIVVHLPGPGKSFEAIVGVDSNQVTTFYSNAGRGRVIASVDVGGKEAFRSGVMREGMPGVPVKVDLSGASEFALGLSDAGGGTVQRVDFNQADWVEARVMLADGGPVARRSAGRSAALRLHDEPPFSFRYGDGDD